MTLSRVLPRPCLLLALPCAVLQPTRALADTPPPAVRHVEEEEAPRVQGDTVVSTYFDDPFLTLRWQPLQLLPAIGTVGAEVKILPQLSAIGNLSLGRVKTVDVATLQDVRKTYLEVELQGRYYFLGSMARGLYGGVQLAYARVDTDQLISGPLLNLAQGMHAGANFGANYLIGLGLGIDFSFVLYYRLYRSTPSVTTPAESQIDRAAPFRLGATLAITYTF